MQSGSGEIEVEFTPSAEDDKKDLSKKKFRHIENDLQELCDDLKRNPEQGPPFGTNGRWHKVHMGSRDMQKGKSGGFRVYTEPTANKVYIWWIIQKSRDEGLNNSQRLAELIRREKQLLARQHEGNKPTQGTE